MYKSYFGFDEAPFSITPDPKFIYMSQRHQDALAHLRYGLLETNGFVLLTGEVGTGKTALCRCLLDQLPKTVNVAFILNPKQTALELVANICDELQIKYPTSTTSIKVLIDLLNKQLLENHTQGKRTILIIDEAQNLSDEVLEQIRLLTNLETSKKKLLQILLVGQPELQAMLARSVMRQLTQRITARYHITALSQVETVAYIRHRMWIAGVQRPIFSTAAINKIYQLCNGTPRLINIICDRALLGAYAKNSDTIDIKTVIQAAQEILPNSQGGFFSPTRKIITASIILASFAVAAYTLPPWRGGAGFSTSHEERELNKPSPAGNSPISSAVKELITPKNNHLAGTTALPLKSDNTSALFIGQSKKTALTVDLALSTLNKETYKNENKAQAIDNEKSSTHTTLKALLNNPDCRSGTETAISNLFNLWGVTYHPQAGRTACNVANDRGLSCIHNKGTWNNLKYYNRPAIIELQNREGNWQHLLITKLSGGNLLLSCANQATEITLKEAGKHWFGEYLILWKPPRKRMRFELGNKGQDVLLFHEQLKTALGIHDKNSNDLFDADLEELVISFQIKNFLEPDGIAGKDTIILLNTVTNKQGTPLLTSAAK